MNNRLSRLESHTRAAHTAAWHYYFQRFRDALAVVPAGAFERFGPVEVDDLDGLEDELLAWEQWGEAILPVLSKAEAGDLSAWPTDLPPPPSDPSPLISELISRWRKAPRLTLGPLLTLLSLGVAVGEGVPLRYGDEHAET